MNGRIQAGLVLALLLVSSSIAMVATTATAAPTDATSDGEEWTLSELQKQGTVTDPRYPSLRVAGDMTAFWLVRYPPRGTGTYGDKGSQEFLKPKTEIHRNKVRLYGSFPFDGKNRTYTVQKVYWRPDSRQVRTANGSVTTERYANVTGTATQKVEFQSGMQRHADLTLSGHYDDAVRVTFLLELSDGQVIRWTARHKSIPTSKPAPDISSRGDLNEYIFLWIVLPTIVLALVSNHYVPKFRRGALAGTGYGAGSWIALGFLLAGAAYMFGYYALASLTAHLPLVFPLFVGWVVAAIQLEDDDDAVESWGFIRLDPQTATSPLDDKAEILDSGDIEIEGFDVVFDDDGEPVLYHKGILSMWARYKGCHARVNINNQEAEWNGHGDYDKVVIVDQNADDLIDHLPSRVIFAWPWRTYQPARDNDGNLIEDDLDPGQLRALPEEIGTEQYVQMAMMAIVPLGAAALSQQFIGTWQWGPLACAPLVARFAEPIEGKARTWVAPGQARKAWTTAWYLDLNVRRFGTIDEILEALIESENKQYSAEEWLSAARDEGLIKEAHNREGKPFDTVLSDADPAMTASEDDSESTATTGGDD